MARLSREKLEYCSQQNECFDCHAEDKFEAADAIQKRRQFPYPRNARTHSKRQIRQIADSIRAFGFTNPVLVDRSGTIVAGHGRVEAAKLLGMKKGPTICLENLNEDQIRAYILADNKLAEKAGWDNAILAIELQHLTSIDLGFDVSLTGFEIPEIDLILQESKAEEQDEEPVEISTEPSPTANWDHTPSTMTSSLRSTHGGTSAHPTTTRCR